MTAVRQSRVQQPSRPTTNGWCYLRYSYAYILAGDLASSAENENVLLVVHREQFLLRGSLGCSKSQTAAQLGSPAVSNMNCHASIMGVSDQMHACTRHHDDDAETNAPTRTALPITPVATNNLLETCLPYHT